MRKSFWSIWCKTMGSKISEDDFESDVAALFRTFYWLVQVITCFFIMAGIIRHW
jgi:hypothetical protein